MPSSWACEPEKSEDKSKDDATMVIVESDKECGCWAAEEVEDELDWFKMAITEMVLDGEFVVEEIPVRDWFVEGENKSRDEGGNLEDAVVEVFGRDASREAFVKDSRTQVSLAHFGQVVMTSRVLACRQVLCLG
jgi:hypothetical protein